MSWSNVIKQGADIQFNICSFDPDTFNSTNEDEEPCSRTQAGALLLPGGPPSKKGRADRVNEDSEEESAEERLARLERESYEKGFEQGRKDGLELEKKQLEQQRQQMEALFAELRDLKPSLLREAEEEAVMLGSRIAKRIIGEEIRTDPSVIQRTVRAALDFVADRSRLSITVHPEDMEEIRRVLPELASMTEGGRFQVTEDDTVDRGGCLLETGFGKINANISEQLSVIDKVIEQTFVSSGKDGS